MKDADRLEQAKKGDRLETEESHLLDINPELTIEDLPELLTLMFQVFKVRLIKLSKARPLDMGSVLSDKEEDEYYSDIVAAAAGDKKFETLELDNVEQLILKHLENSDY